MSDLPTSCPLITFSKKALQERLKYLLFLPGMRNFTISKNIKRSKWLK